MNEQLKSFFVSGTNLMIENKLINSFSKLIYCIFLAFVLFLDNTKNTIVERILKQNSYHFDFGLKAVSQLSLEKKH